MFGGSILNLDMRSNASDTCCVGSRFIGEAVTSHFHQMLWILVVNARIRVNGTD
jgi:hypothetical protein